ncbi:MAG: tripartite tricarboxylate transporter substrate binding protein, partial [Betaproteobacteria bacterium]
MMRARAIAAIALLFTACSALAQRATGGEHSYPRGLVRVILPFPAGGGVDAAGRILAQKLAEALGKPFVI